MRGTIPKRGPISGTPALRAAGLPGRHAHWTEDEKKEKDKIKIRITGAGSSAARKRISI